MGSTAGPESGGTIIRAAWRQPGLGKLSESVSNTPGLSLGSLYFVSSGGACWPTVSYPGFPPRTRPQRTRRLGWTGVGHNPKGAGT